MKKLPLIITSLAIASVSVLSACKFSCIKGSGHTATDTRKVEKFTRIEIEGGYKVNLKQDSSMAVTINADDNLLKYIKTSVSGGTLHIESKKSFCNAGELSVDIGIGKLEQLKISGAADVSAAGKLNVQDLKLELKGANKVDLDVNAANLVTEGSGSTELHLAGQASSHKIDFSGSGKLYAFDFVVGNYRIETSGATECEINVLHELSIDSRGATSIKYKGSPSVIHNDKSGASSVEKVQ